MKMVSYDALVPMHHLWLSYMAELLQLAIVPRKSGTTESTVTVETTTAMYPTFPPRHESLGSALEPAINVQSAHAKLVKAEFVGASIRGTFHYVSRAGFVSDNSIDSETRQEHCPGQFGGNRVARDPKHFQDRDSKVSFERSVQNLQE